MLARRRLSIALSAALVAAGVFVLVGPSSQVAAAPADGTTVRASVADGNPGAQADDGGDQSVISGNGRYDAFVSSDDLSSFYQGERGNDGDDEVYVRDLQTGTTTQISVGYAVPNDPTDPDVADGSASLSDVEDPDISADGRYVSFIDDNHEIGSPPVLESARAEPLDTLDGTFLPAIVVCDRDPDGNGVFDEPTDGGYPAISCRVVDVTDTDYENEASYSNVSLSGDGQRVAFSETQFSRSGQLKSADVVVASGPTVSNLGYPQARDTHSLDHDNLPTFPEGGARLYESELSADGLHVVYSAISDVSNQTDQSDEGIFETTVAADSTPGATTRVDIQSVEPTRYIGGPLGELVIHVGEPTVDGDGGEVAFVAGIDRDRPELYYLRATDGSTAAIRADNRPTNGTDESPYGNGADPTLSADGRYLAFETDQIDEQEGAASHTPPDRTCIHLRGFEEGDNITNVMPCQVVVRDMVRYYEDYTSGADVGYAQLASASTDTDCFNDSDQPTLCVGDDDSGVPSLSDNGARVGWTSYADDLVAGDDNSTCDSECQEEEDCSDCGRSAPDAFVRTWTPTITASQTSLDLGSVRVGRHSDAGYTFTVTGFGPVNVSGVTLSGPDADQFSVDASDCEGAATYAPDTCVITVTFRPTSAGPKQATLTVETSNGFATSSGTGTLTGTGLPPIHAITSTIVRTSVGDGDPGAQAAGGSTGTSMVSGNGHYDVFVSRDDLDGRKTDDHSNVFVRDLQTNKTRQISIGADVTGAAHAVQPNGDVPDGDSFAPSISADGRFVSFVTYADNVVPTTAGGGDQQINTVVVCDRDPNGDGVFDQDQGGARAGVPDYRCIHVDDFPVSIYADPAPRLSPDGKHLVWAHCIQDEGHCFSQVELAGLAFTGTALSGTTAPLDVPDIATGSPRAPESQPQVSDERTTNGETVVRVAFATGSNEIMVTDMFADPVTYRVDVKPGHPSQFVGGNVVDNVGNPSLSDDGSEVAFDSTDLFSGDATAYVVRVTDGGAATSRYVSLTNADQPVRAADPALSGDGRYVSYVTDSPEFQGSPQKTPAQSCLHLDTAGLSDAPPDATYTSCQIVARDLVTDRTRASAGSDPLPDMLVTQSGQVPPPCDTAPTVYGNACGADGDSLDPSMSHTGARAGFDSVADDLVADDTNDADAAAFPPMPSAQDAFVASFNPKASADEQDFGQVTVHTTAMRSAAISVDGFGPYELQNAAVTQPSDATGAPFGVTPGSCQVPGTVLHAGETCALTVSFRPDKVGRRTGSVTVTAQDDPNKATFTVTGVGLKHHKGPPGHCHGSNCPPVHCHGSNCPVHQPQFTVSPTSIDFGVGLPLDKPKHRTLTISNGGDDDLVVTGVQVVEGAIPGAAKDYKVVLSGDSGCSPTFVPAHESCSLTISWVGHAVGDRSAILRFHDNAGVQNVPLHARVVQPKIRVNPFVVPSGHVTIVTGRGFAPRRMVTISNSAGTETARVKASKHGRFSVGVVIFPTGVRGMRIMKAVSVHANRSISAGAPMLVTLGTLQSPTLVIRH